MVRGGSTRGGALQNVTGDSFEQKSHTVLEPLLTDISKGPNCYIF